MLSPVRHGFTSIGQLQRGSHFCLDCLISRRSPRIIQGNRVRAWCNHFQCKGNRKYSLWGQDRQWACGPRLGLRIPWTWGRPTAGTVQSLESRLEGIFCENVIYSSSSTYLELLYINSYIIRTTHSCQIDDHDEQVRAEVSMSLTTNRFGRQYREWQLVEHGCGSDH